MSPIPFGIIRGFLMGLWGNPIAGCLPIKWMKVLQSPTKMDETEKWMKQIGNHRKSNSHREFLQKWMKVLQSPTKMDEQILQKWMNTGCTKMDPPDLGLSIAVLAQLIKPSTHGCEGVPWCSNPTFGAMGPPLCNVQFRFTP